MLRAPSMASEPTAPRDVRPVAAGLCLVAAILAWPLVRVAAADERGDPEPKTGIAVFPPRGTDPPKTGIVVPDDYQLPPGYVRHYQTTDDGKQLPPILMFHPDFHPVDDRGQPIAVPADRVVPPEMAPPGLRHDAPDVPATRVPMAQDPPR
jgi:hypothetical protein